VPARWVDTRNVLLSELARYPGNARRGSVDDIRASIRRHGQYRSLVVRDAGAHLEILAGNHTYDALMAEGHIRARVEIIDCDDDEARRIVIADNRIADKGSYDDDALAELLSYLDSDYEGTGWTEGEVLGFVHTADWVPGPEDDAQAGPLMPGMIACPSCGSRFSSP
jgi:ParB-like nuclease domain